MSAARSRPMARQKHNSITLPASLCNPKFTAEADQYVRLQIGCLESLLTHDGAIAGLETDNGVQCSCFIESGISDANTLSGSMASIHTGGSPHEHFRFP